MNDLDKNRSVDIGVLAARAANQSDNQLMQITDLQKQFNNWHSWARILVPWFLGILSTLIVGLLLVLIRRTP